LPDDKAGDRPVNTIFQRRHFQRLLKGTLFLLLVHAAGTVGYLYFGRPTATVIDSFYMTFITIASIGFSEVVDLSQHPMGRLFTVMIAVVGMATMSFLLSTLVALLVDSELNAALRRKRMEKGIGKLKGHYIVCGMGRVGSNVAMELMKTQRPFVVIEPDRPALDRWLEHHPQSHHLHDDAASDDALQYAGVMAAAGVFAVTGDDSYNLMIAMSVKLINPKARVVVRLHDIRNTQKARRAGADEIVSPDFTGGMHIAAAMVRPLVVNFMDKMLHDESNLRVEEVTLPPGIGSTPVGALIPRSRDYILMATHDEGQWQFNPGDDYLVQTGTTLVFMASPAGRQDVERLLKR
jgi:voltage-gated potassium channel